MTIVNLERNENAQDIDTYLEASRFEEHATLIQQIESGRTSESGSHFHHWGLNVQTTGLQIKDSISQQFRKIFQKNQSRESMNGALPTTSRQDCNCSQPISMLKDEAKSLFTLKILFSLIFSVATIFIPNTESLALAIFILDLIAIVPLSITLTLATERISHGLGQTVGAILNFSIGNVAELLILITTLMKDKIKVVQSSLLGSILVNLLLVLGSAIIAGSLKSPSQTYNNDLTQACVGLLNLTVSCFMMPSAFYGSVNNHKTADHMALSFSRAVSVILLGIYCLYLFFQFRSHAALFQPGTSRLRVQVESQHPDTTRDQMFRVDNPSPPSPPMEMQQTSSGLASPLSAPADPQTEPGLPLIQCQPPETKIPYSHGQNALSITRYQPCNRYRHVILAHMMSLTLLVISAILIAICADHFASSFITLNENGVLGESFVGLIVIPVAGNLAENVTAVIVAAKGEMDLAVNVALGSAIQIGLLVSPVMVLAGWALDKPTILHSDRFGMVTLVGSTLLVSFIVLKGKTNYLEGAILCACYAAISVGAFLLPMK